MRRKLQKRLRPSSFLENFCAANRMCENCGIGRRGERGSPREFLFDSEQRDQYLLSNAMVREDSLAIFEVCRRA